MNRRSFVGALGAGIAAGVAGCNAFGSESDSVEEELTIDPTDSELSASAFRTAAADSHDVYGSGGVWGRRGSEPDHDLEYLGAWSATLTHPDGARSDHLLAMYRLPPAPDGAASAQVWLWSGVDPADAGEVRRIATGISLPAGGASLGIYSPAQDYDADDVSGYPVESGRLDVVTPGTTMPLPGGSVGIESRTRIGEGGAYVPFWAGESETPRSLAATTETRWESDPDTDVQWTLTVETAP